MNKTKNKREKIQIYRKALLDEAYKEMAVDSDEEFIKDYFCQFINETEKKLKTLYDEVYVSDKESNVTFSEEPSINLEFTTFWEWL